MFERVYTRSRWYQPLLSEGPIASVGIHVVACVVLVVTGTSPVAIARQVAEGIVFLAPLPTPAAGPTEASEPLRYVEMSSAITGLAIDNPELRVGPRTDDAPPEPEPVTFTPAAATVATSFERPADSIYFAEQVDSPAAYDERSAAPAYPDSLQRARVEGAVMAQFVIDTSGRVEMETVKVLSSTNLRFTQSVLEALPRMLFRPAVLNGAKARQIVEVPFKFRVVATKDTTKTRDTSWARPPH